MQRLKKEYTEFFAHFPYITATLEAFMFFFVSLIINYYASRYAFIKKDNPVTDIILDHLPVVDMGVPFIVGTWVVVLFIIGLLLCNPKKVAFTMKAMAFFIIVRSIFVSMTHFGPSPLNTLSEPGEIGRAFSLGADLFFSGHTGMPFLYALIFWKNKTLRVTFFVCSISAAIGVLLGHIHYSIDVASAYFITHGIYLLSKRFFKKDLALFENGN